MEPSVFEKLSDRIIFSIIKKINNEIDIDMVENSADNEFSEVVTHISRLYSIDASIQDIDFLYNIIVLNQNLFDEDTLTTKLERPTLKNYEYNWVIRMRSIVDEYYRNTISLYSSKDDVNDVLITLRSEGTLDVFEGDLYEEDSRDSEIIDDDLYDVSQI